MTLFVFFLIYSITLPWTGYECKLFYGKTSKYFYLLSSVETLRKYKLFTLKTEVVIIVVRTFISVIISGVIFSAHDVSAGV